MPGARRRAVLPLAAAQQGTLLAEAVGPAVAAGSAASPGALSGGERLQVVDTLATVIGGAYAHLPAKRAAYAVDPVQALGLLRRRVTDLTDADFHLAVTGLVTGLRDAHTRYIGPSSLRGRVAALPFLVEQVGSYAAPGFVVTKVAADVAAHDAQLVPGVTLEEWNGVPFARAVDVYADRETGGRPDARRARALESLTFRALDYGPPPDERWVELAYRTSRGARRVVRLPWRVLVPGRAVTAVAPGSPAWLKIAADPAAEAVRRAKKLLFAGTLWASDARGSAAGAADAATPGDWLDTSFQDVVGARVVPVGRRRLGYLRLWSFDVDDDDAFVDEVQRLLGLLPQDGVVVDLRGNPGGLVWAAERLVQLFAPGRVVPTRFSLVASPLTRAMADSPFNALELQAWAPSLETAVSTGDLYAQPLPLTDPAWCNDRGRSYPGPAVAVVDANTYSSGDLFAAGWVDNGVGPVVSVGQGTGAGGANVWTFGQLRDALDGTAFALDALPEGVGLTLAIRRAVRSGASDGVPIEDLGVAGIPYAMTRGDLLHANTDLLAFCARLLAPSG